jgi:hypothetical protein
MLARIPHYPPSHILNEFRNIPIQNGRGRINDLDNAMELEALPIAATTLTMVESS